MKRKIFYQSVFQLFEISFLDIFCRIIFDNFQIEVVPIATYYNVKYLPNDLIEEYYGRGQIITVYIVLHIFRTERFKYLSMTLFHKVNLRVGN